MCLKYCILLHNIMYPSKKQDRPMGTPKQVIITVHYFTDIKWAMLLNALVKKR